MNSFSLMLNCPKGLAETLHRELRMHGYTGDLHHQSLILIKDCQLKDIAYLNEFIHCAESVEIVLYENLLQNLETLTDALTEVSFSEFFTNELTFGVKGFRSGTHSFNSVALSTAVATGMTRSLMREGITPKANLKHPDLEFFVRLYDQDVYVTLNTTGQLQSDAINLPYKHIAPIKRVLAAGLIYNSSALMSGEIIDPMCGGATLALEAMWIHEQKPLSTLRQIPYAFHKHFYYKQMPDVFSKLSSERTNCEIILGDSSRNKIKGAILNLEHYNLRSQVRLYRGNATKMKYLSEDKKINNIIVNPPYGIRVKNSLDVDILYQEFAKNCRARSVGEVVAITPRKRSWISSFEACGYQFDYCQAVDFSGLPTSILRAKLN